MRARGPVPDAGLPAGHRRPLRDALNAWRHAWRARIALATAASLVLGLAMICSALFWLFAPPPAVTDGDRPSSYTEVELARHDGVEGRDCLVAVDGDVFRIRGFALWSMGRHTPSGGRARCGLDLSDVIDESPHGRSKLRLLEKVGVLESR